MYDKIPLDALLLTLTSSDDQTESLSSMTASVMDVFPSPGMHKGALRSVFLCNSPCVWRYVFVAKHIPVEAESILQV